MKEEYSSYAFSEDFHLVDNAKTVGYEIIETLLSFLCFYPVLAFIVYMFNHSETDVYKGMLLIIPVLAMVIIKGKIRRLILFIAAYLVIAVLGTISLRQDELLIFYFVFLLIHAIYYINKRLKNINSFWRFKNLIAMNIFSAMVYIITLINDFILLRGLMLTFAILQLLISIIYFHFSSTNKLLKWEKYSDEEHAKNIRTVNVMFSIIMVVIIGIVILIAVQTDFFKWLDSVNKNIIYAIFSEKDLSKVPKPEDMNTSENPMFKPPELEVGESSPSLFFRFAALLFKVVFGAAATISIIVIIISLFQGLYRLFVRTLNTDEAVESMFSAKDIADNLKKSIKKPVLSLRKAMHKDNKDKLRKLYYQAVMNYKKRGISIEQWNTPTEIEDNINKKDNIQFGEITDLYERFRYTSQEPSDEEVVYMKRKISDIIKRGR